MSSQDCHRGGRGRAALLAGAALLAAAALASSAPALAATGGIGGTVTAAASGAPVASAEVCVYQPAVWGAPVSCGSTGPDGTYLLQGIPAGEYKVGFSTSKTGLNLAGQMYDHTYGWEEAKVVTVAEGAPTSEIDARLDVGGQITGVVRDAATGAALPGIRVCSYWAETGTKRSCVRSNAAGSYLLERLQPRAFKVGFSLEQGIDLAKPPEDDHYLTQFWDRQPSLETASEISVTLGGVVAGIDANLTSTLPQPAATKPKKRCKRGFRKRRTKAGKVRCVRVKKRNQQRRGGAARS